MSNGEIKCYVSEMQNMRIGSLCRHSHAALGVCLSVLPDIKSRLLLEANYDEREVLDRYDVVMHFVITAHDAY